ISADKQVTIVDTVTYENLTPGKTYTLKGTLMDKETGKALVIDGAKVTATKTFTPKAENGTVKMTFTFDASDLTGLDIVVFEKLYLGSTLVAEHADINDEGQTVHVGNEPSIRTTATGEDGGKTIAPTEKATIVDTVTYKNLTPGKTYTLKGTLMNKETGEALVIDGEKVTATKTFTPKEKNGTVKLTFSFDASALKGKELVVFEKLYLGGELVAKHTNINDENQTVKIKKSKIGILELFTDGDYDETGSGNVNGTPKTGDTTPIAALLALFVASLAGAIYLLFSKNGLLAGSRGKAKK
ncbi:MAG: VaFE repeat-containing surface-anchored protein, partial [Anaerovoracaceae bacterium]